MRQPNELDIRHLSRAEELIRGEKSFEEYSLKRGITSKVKLDEMHFLSLNSINFNLFIENVTVGCRFLAMKALLHLKIADIVANSGYSKTTIYDFINDNLQVNQYRYFSDNLVYHLSIILDLPYKYFMSHSIRTKINSYDEYELESITTVSFEKALCLINSKLKDTKKSNREIFGLIIENSIFKYEVGYLFTRVDIRRNWYTIEIYLSNPLSINNHALKEMLKFTNGESQFFIRDAFLREGKKLILRVCLEDYPEGFDEFPYLGLRLPY
jgi:DNA-binding transcriptional MerR regulator